ncbi:MAG: hypothetical protein H3C43_09470 [Leptonema sp. (in: Bacteria)]|nr:hypothetical protein [Leptonema sp. (in: bacteria)]
MKHLFVVHSYTTLIVAKLTIEHLRLKRDDVRFFCTRNLKPFVEDEDISFSFDFQVISDPFPITKNIFKGRFYLKLFDKKVSKIIDSHEFVLYTYDFATSFNQILMSHKLCTGLAAYNNYNFLNSLYKTYFSRKDKLFNWLNYSNRLKNYGFLENPQRIFALSDDSFPGQDIVNVFNSTSVQRILSSVEFFIPEDAIIFVLDSISSFKIVNMEQHLEQICNTVNILSKSIIYLKFHPSQDQIERDLILNIIEKQRFTVNIIPANVPLEKFVFNTFSYTFVGNVSSILLYAAMNKKKAFSFHRKLSQPPLPQIFDYYVADLYAAGEFTLITNLDLIN